MKRGKKWREVRGKISRTQEYELAEAIDLIKQSSHVKFDETLDIAVNLGVQTVRSSVVLPHGLGKTTRVLAFAVGDKEKEAKDAGADYVGGEELAEKIQGGWLGFETVVATPDMMKVVGKLGKILGTRGLMPNPKVGTVTMEIGKAIKDAKKGKVDFRVEKGAILHAPLGKVSFDRDHLVENTRAFMDAVYKAKPSSAKGSYIKKVTLSSTMGQGLKIKVADVK
jgi:large subunit ribosomal protein L1